MTHSTEKHTNGVAIYTAGVGDDVVTASGDIKRVTSVDTDTSYPGFVLLYSSNHTTAHVASDPERGPIYRDVVRTDWLGIART